MPAEAGTHASPHIHDARLAPAKLAGLDDYSRSMNGVGSTGFCP